MSGDFDEMCKISLDFSAFEVDDKIEFQILIPAQKRTVSAEDKKQE